MARATLILLILALAGCASPALEASDAPPLSAATNAAPTVAVAATAEPSTTATTMPTATNAPATPTPVELSTTAPTLLPPAAEPTTTPKPTAEPAVLPEATELPLIFDLTTPPPPPTPAPLPTPGPPPTPGPTMTPLPSPLTAKEALALAVELDGHFTSRVASPEEVAASATVVMYDTASVAHAALGQEAGYAPEIEAEIGQVWLISIPDPFWGLKAPGAGHDPWAAWDGIHYFISARTGVLLGLTTGVRLPGLSVLFARDDDLYRANVAGDLVERLTENGALGWGMSRHEDDWWMAARWLPPRVSPDGNWIAFSPNGRRMYLAGVGDPTVRELPLTGSQFYAWSPDSRWLVYATQNDDVERGQLNVYDLYDERATPMLNEIVPNIKGLAWSPDGRRLAFGCCFEEEYSAAGDYLGASIGQLRVMDLVTGQIEIAGELRSTIAGGLERFCWTADNRIGESVVEEAEWSAQCSTPPDGYWIAFSPDRGSGTPT